MITIRVGRVFHRWVHWYSGIRVLTLALGSQRGLRISFGRRATVVSNMLAVLCRDGGQYLDLHGFDAACAEAVARFHACVRELGDMEHQVDQLVGALVGGLWDDAETETERFKRALAWANKLDDYVHQLRDENAALRAKVEELESRSMPHIAVAELLMSVFRSRK